ncbi:unnamed protein product [Mytilus edulis]|uniref:Uncharacterized protein n=1 Tax=Mytilus edulis TaxID=6550 RepID=A0A8S3TPE5_MYTED|nr:unnamed protein product [Mytilus edulis]
MLIKSDRPTHDIPPLRDPDHNFNLAYEGTEKSEILNKYFCSISNINDANKDLPEFDDRLLLKLILLFTVQINTSSEWNMVFKIATGGSGGIYDLYTNSQTQNIDDPEARLFTPTSKHFKSEIINKWSTVGIEQVKVVIYKNGVEKAFFNFDGMGSTSTNWFKLDKLLSSSYSDLKGADTGKIGFYFDLRGLEDTKNVNYRRFYVNGAWDTSGHCLDSGWLMVSDVLSTGDCQYETNHLSRKPFILFSPYATQIAFGKANMDEILADSLAIFVKCKYELNIIKCCL